MFTPGEREKCAANAKNAAGAGEKISYIHIRWGMSSFPL